MKCSTHSAQKLERPLAGAPPEANHPVMLHANHVNQLALFWSARHATAEAIAVYCRAVEEPNAAYRAAMESMGR